MRAFENAEREMARGNLWRAREILQGTIPNAGYDCTLFEKLGVVLLKMGDLLEAGRFLFLSGRREPAYEQSISIFLYRYGRRQPLDLFNAFPRQARLASVSEYPETVRQALLRLGFSEVLKTKNGEVLVSAQKSNDAVIIVTCLSIALITVTLLILGIIKLLEILVWIRDG